MIAIRVTGFSGIVPRASRRALDASQAQVAMNCKLTSGELRALTAPLDIYRPLLTGDIKSIYRMTSAGVDKWLAWTRDVDVAKGAVAGDTSQRIYFTGDGEPRTTNYALATTSEPYPTAYYVLGVFPPKTAPTVTPTGGSGTLESRAYVYTYVTPWGEESAPSPASAVASGYPNATWALSAMDAAPPNSGTVSAAVKDTPSAGYVTVTLDTVFGLRASEEVTFAGVVGMTDINGTFPIVSVDTALNKVVIAKATTQTYTSVGTWARKAPHNTSGMTKRIYRTFTDSSGTSYKLVAEIAVATTTYNDTVAGTALGLTLPSADWAQPPADMIGLIELPNGLMAAFSKNEVCFCEPYYPHAWPIKYRQACSWDVVGLGAFGTTVAVGTKGQPYLIGGTDPAAMSMVKVDQEWPCLSKRGMVGALYPAPQGLVNLATQQIMTRAHFTQSEWAEEYPETFIAAMHDGAYFAGYTIDATSGHMIIINPQEFAVVTEVNERVTAIWSDRTSGKLYVVIDGIIHLWEGEAGLKMAYDWMSKEFLFLPPVNLSAMKVDADFSMSPAEIAAAQSAYDAVVAANQALLNAYAEASELGGNALGDYALGLGAMQDIPPLSWDSLQVSIYINNALKFTRTVTDSRAFRLPSGYKADNVAVRVAGNVKVYGVVFAETMEGLKAA